MKDDLVTIAELARRKGMSEPAIRGRIAGGQWVQGTHYFRRGRRIMMSMNAIEAWFKSDTTQQEKKARRRR